MGAAGRAGHGCPAYLADGDVRVWGGQECPPYRWGDACLLAGPVFTREAVIVPRRPRMYLSRAVYVIGLWVLMLTLWMVFTGTQQVRNLGDLARFGHVLFLSLSA